MTPEILISLALNGILGLAMWSLKTNYDNLKEQVTDNREDIDSVKEHYFKKEDFRDFRNELWTRLDKMEASFEAKLVQLNKDR